MKYGVIVFKESENLGDDIQSYAAKKFLPKIDYYIERESLDLFVPNEKEKVKVIMNGWFLHYKYTFFPSPYIDPLYISTHFSSYKTFGIENEYIEVNKDYLKEYEPIGCRDIQTQKLLEKYDIKNYFSGCVTLTIDKFDIKKTEKDYICCVDVSKKISDYLKKKSKIEIKIMTHTLDKNNNIKLSWDERFNNVEKILKIYQNAKMVITSRLHVALPCLALGVPVILLKDDDSIYYKDRINTYLEFLNTFTEKEFLKKDFDEIIELKNSNKYQAVRKLLIKNIKEGICVEPNNSNLPDTDSYKKLYVSQKEKQNNIFKIMSNDYKKIYDSNKTNESKVDYWEKEFNTLNNKYMKEHAEKEEEKNTIEYWKKEFEILNNKYMKEHAEKEEEKNTIEYWKREFNILLEKYENKTTQ